jgi:hypothetical protein
MQIGNMFYETGLFASSSLGFSSYGSDAVGINALTGKAGNDNYRFFLLTCMP